MPFFFYAAEIWSAGEQKYKVAGIVETGGPCNPLDWNEQFRVVKEAVASKAGCDSDDLIFTALNPLP